MRNRTYGGVRGRKTKVGEKLLRFPPTRLNTNLVNDIPYYSHEKRHDCNFNTMKTIQKQIIQNYEID